MSTTPDPLLNTDALAELVRAFDQTVRQETSALLDHYQATSDPGKICYVNQPGQPHRIRPWCDALEIGLAFDILPGPLTAGEWISNLRNFQNPETGLVPEFLSECGRATSPLLSQLQFAERYNTMIVNYALEGLGSSLAHPVANAENVDAELLVETLDSLDWKNGAWSAGHWIDCYASCLYINKKYFRIGHQIDQLFDWLDTHVDQKTGLWGKPRQEDRWLQPVNGFYRLTRGTYAQFGRPLPHPEKAIDSILLHAADVNFFAVGRGSACNVLDVVHPLWLCLQLTSHRREEAQKWILDRLPDALKRWQPGHGYAFDPQAADVQNQPSLQGTEMWLTIIYLMATAAGLAENLSYCPKGVHRLQAALT